MHHFIYMIDTGPNVPPDRRAAVSSSARQNEQLARVSHGRCHNPKVASNIVRSYVTAVRTVPNDPRKIVRGTGKHLRGSQAHESRLNDTDPSRPDQLTSSCNGQLMLTSPAPNAARDDRQAIESRLTLAIERKVE
jgi:hypothetical protein